MTEKTIDKSKTVTIDRHTYNILLAAYKAFEAAERAAWARSAVPMLTPGELDSLDQA